MIRVVIDEAACSLTVCGHAEYAEAGQDIVCAAASILVYTLAERLKAMDSLDHAEFRDGFASVGATARSNAEAALETIACGFALLAKNYPNNIDVEGGDISPLKFDTI